MIRPRLLDLFCCAGGAAVGYHRAGFDVVGIDIKPQPHYPFEFHQSDALEYAREHGAEFDAIHASPPCQTYSTLKHLVTKSYPSLIDVTLELLQEIGLPYVVENVPGSNKHLKPNMMLCGHQFGLRVYRHRFFATNPMLLAPPHIKHPEACPRSGRGRSEKYGFISVTGNGGAPNLGMPYLDYARLAMGIDWMSRAEISEAIPPAYTEFIGRYLLQHIADLSNA